jgi:cytochrome c-type biogenesis protein CcmF
MFRTGQVWLAPGKFGTGMLWVGLIASLLTVIAYALALRKGDSKKSLLIARSFYAVSAIGILAAFASLMAIVYGLHFEYKYAIDHSGTGMSTWYSLAATWAGQEGSFLLWGAWTAIFGFLVFTCGGKYEARVMPFYVTVIGMLCAILIKQSPFELIPAPSAADLAANPGWHWPPLEGAGLNPSLQNYWMTIHPPTIFFGFASLLVPFCYAVAALIWRDYDGWTSRVMPYSLLSCGTLGLGLFMGGYWAYETQGWHGFWAWDPVENASFFPWLSVTALVHGLVVQKSRGGMGKTNTFLGIFSFWLFVLGTFLTRSGVLADVSIHAFANIGKSGLALMVVMMVVYGVGGFGLWLWRVKDIPGRKTTGDTLVSRDFAFFLAVTLLILACVFVTLGTTAPLAQKLLHKPLSPPQAVFYNRSMMPLAIAAGLLMGVVPWLAWKKTDPDKFLRKLVVPWVAMVVFGFLLLLWVLGAERASQASRDLSDEAVQNTLRAWITPQLQRVSVVLLASVGFLAVLSNAALAARVFRSKRPFAAGGWLAHVGMGVLMIGVIVSNTYERTERVDLIQGRGPKSAFDYQFEFEKMTAKPYETRPINPDFVKDNGVQLRVTPPESEGRQADGSRTFLATPRWFVHNLATMHFEDEAQSIRWPDIHKYLGHDLYVGLAGDPEYVFVDPDNRDARQQITLQPKQKIAFGPYMVGYYDKFGTPGKEQGIRLAIAKPDNTVVEVDPVIEMGVGDDGKPHMSHDKYAIKELRDENNVPGVARLDRIDPATKAATVSLSLPGPTTSGVWVVHAEVTYKPWVNLVWAGVLIAVLGIFVSAIHRAFEARRVLATGKEDAVLDLGEDDEEPASVVPTAVPTRTPGSGKAAKRKPARQA